MKVESKRAEDKSPEKDMIRSPRVTQIVNAVEVRNSAAFRRGT
jgi:hypothetical protein